MMGNVWEGMDYRLFLLFPCLGIRMEWVAMPLQTFITLSFIGVSVVSVEPTIDSIPSLSRKEISLILTSSSRLNALSKIGLIEYRRQVKDLAVIEYITNQINQMPALPPCTSEEAKETGKQAEAARVASLPLVADAVKALGTVANNSLLCAFISNFNTPGDAPEFQTRRLIVARRLAALASKMKTAVPFACVPADDSVCMKPGKADTVAYVVDHKPPIKFCPSFRSLADDMTGLQQAIVIHEYAHLVGGIDDSGGYASNGPQIGTCTINSKFKAQGDVLINTADALTGFVMHVGLGLTPATPISKGTAAMEEQKNNELA